MDTLIAYYRVSTARQGQSGLGLEAQRAAVVQHAKQHGATIAEEYIEVESGKRVDRPQLASALARARRAGARLVIAKLDRLARNVAFVSALMESGVDFVCVDNPNANRLTVHILAAVAENEARAISERTRVALRAAKARGTLLGSARPGHWDGREDRRLAGTRLASIASAKSRRSAAMAVVADLMPEIKRRRSSGESLMVIANALNEAGHRTARGASWSPVQVFRSLSRAAIAAA